MQLDFHAGEWLIQPQFGTVSKDGKRVTLDPKVMDVLVCLASNPGQVCSKERIIQSVWPDTFVGDGVVTHAIFELRKAFEDSPREPSVIETLHKRGYRLMVPVARNGDELECEIDQPAITARVRERASRHWVPISAAGLGLTMVALALITLWISKPSASPSPPVLRRLTTDTGLTFQPSLSPDGTLLAYVSDRAGEGNLDIWLKSLAGGEPIRLTNHEADESQPNFSPDGSKIAFRSERDGGGVYIVPTLGGEARLIAIEGRRPRFSPDGQFVAYWIGSEHLGMAGQIYVVAVHGGQPRQVHPGRSPVWSPDGTHLLFMELSPVPDPDWAVVDLHGADPVKTGAVKILQHQALIPVPGRLGKLFIPDDWVGATGYVFFAARFGDSINVWKVPISQETWQVAGPASQVTSGVGIEKHASVAPSGRLAFSALNENLDVWSLPLEASEGRPLGPIERLTNSAAADTSPSVSIDGEKIVFRSERSGNWDIWIKDLETNKEVALTMTQFDEGNPHIAGDGSMVAYRARRETGQITVYALPSTGGLAEVVLAEFPNSLAVSDWSIQCKSILCFGNGGLSLLDRSSGKRTKLEANGAAPTFSPDNRWIAFHQLDMDPIRRQLFILPFRKGIVVNKSDWIAVTDNSGSNCQAAWSPDGNLLYFLSDRDGFRCIWAQRLDPVTKQPSGQPQGVYHPHRAQRSLVNVNPATIGLSVCRDKLVFSMQEQTGNIWTIDHKDWRMVAELD